MFVVFLIGLERIIIRGISKILERIFKSSQRDSMMVNKSNITIKMSKILKLLWNGSFSNFNGCKKKNRTISTMISKLGTAFAKSERGKNKQRI